MTEECSVAAVWCRGVANGVAWVTTPDFGATVKQHDHNHFNDKLCCDFSNLEQLLRWR